MEAVFLLFLLFLLWVVLVVYDVGRLVDWHLIVLFLLLLVLASVLRLAVAGEAAVTKACWIGSEKVATLRQDCYLESRNKFDACLSHKLTIAVTTAIRSNTRLLGLCQG
jgi:hypothetical protein